MHITSLHLLSKHFLINFVHIYMHILTCIATYIHKGIHSIATLWIVALMYVGFRYIYW